MRVGRGELYTGRAFPLVMMAFTVLPFLSLFTTALHPSGSLPSGLSWPAHPEWGNFVEAFNVANMTTLLASSTFIVVAVVPVSLVISTMAGFAIGLLRIPGAQLLLLVFVFGLTLPFEGIITPLYFIERDMGILNTRVAIVLPLIGLFMPFAVFWMRAHFAAMPEEVTEAALVDRLPRDPHVGVDVEPIPARPRSRRGPETADDGRRPRSIPGPLRDRHPAALRRHDHHPPAHPRCVHPLPTTRHRSAAPGIGEGMM
jgi:ABC-type Fe3+ transport system permease subunit